MVGLLITKLRNVYCDAMSASEKKVKSVNIWQSYKQERGGLVHFLRLLSVHWPGAQSA